MNRLPISATLTTVVLLASVLSGGCSHLGEGSSPDGISGFYDGDWYGPDAEKPLGELTCTIVRRDSATWDATFSATFGGFGEYDVALEGRREGDKVVFGGSMDLGETSGGVFDWKGEIVGGRFAGSYTSRFINGTFRMVKTSPEGASQ